MAFEIDYCPACRGVWLDRGELDKLIQLSAAAPVTHAPVQHGTLPSGRRDFDDSDFSRPSGRGTRRKSWLSEIFD